MREMTRIEAVIVVFCMSHIGYGAIVRQVHIRREKKSIKIY